MHGSEIIREKAAEEAAEPGILSRVNDPGDLSYFSN
jgi:hypothetical protein